MVHDPLSPSEAIRTRTGAVLGAVSLFALVYSLLVLGQILLGVSVAFVLAVGPYLSYRLFTALDALADAAQRIAAAREREAESDSRFAGESEREPSSAGGVGDREPSVTDRERER
jgi:hypothetical protein